MIVGLAAPIMQLLEHRPPIRIAYNGSVLAIAAVIASAAVSPLRGDTAGHVLAQVAVAALTHFGVNLLLISLVVGDQRRQAVPRALPGRARRSRRCRSG